LACRDFARDVVQALGIAAGEMLLDEDALAFDIAELGQALLEHLRDLRAAWPVHAEIQDADARNAGLCRRLRWRGGRRPSRGLRLVTAATAAQAEERDHECAAVHQRGPLSGMVSSARALDSGRAKARRGCPAVRLGYAHFAERT